MYFILFFVIAISLGVAAYKLSKTLPTEENCKYDCDELCNNCKKEKND
jgi:hypothetical protein